MTKTEQTFELDIEALTDRDPYANILIYGESGVGKTVFASTAPRPILWLEAEGGLLSISDKEGIDVARVSGLETYRQALGYLQTNKAGYKSVVIDSLTETQAAILKNIMGAAKKAEPSRDEFSPQFGEWAKLVGVIREIIRAYRDLPLNLVITALQREDVDEMTGRSKVKPRLSPTLAEEVPGFMDAVLYLYAATQQRGEIDKEGVGTDEEGLTVVRNALLKPTGKYVAKARIPKGMPHPDYISDPTFNVVAELLGLAQ